MVMLANSFEALLDSSFLCALATYPAFAWPPGLMADCIC